MFGITSPSRGQWRGRRLSFRAQENYFLQESGEVVCVWYRYKEYWLIYIYPEAKNVDLFKKLKRNFTSMVLGDREGITLIGPASVVKAIRKDPDKIQLFSFNLKK